MTEVVIEVGPGAIRGANDVRPEWVSAALDCIDDEIALLDDRPVSVRDLWDEVMSAAAGSDVDIAVLVCPAWWSSARIDTVQQAARTVATDVVLLSRTAMLREGISADATIVEIATDVAIVTVFEKIVSVVPRQGVLDEDVEAVVAALGAPAGVLVDAPKTVFGAELLASSVTDRMRVVGVPVRIADDGWIRRAAVAQRSHAAAQPAEVAVRSSGRLRDRKTLAVLFGVMSTVVLCGGVAAVQNSGSDRVDEMPMTLLVEGRIGLMVPAAWTTQRITSGPGSARVQVVSPTDGDLALHVTQSVLARPSSLAKTADTLLAALAESADGAFVDFDPSDRRAGRDAVTYREIRPERNVAWTVLIDGTARIAIGCQSLPHREHLVREACDRAIRSAHAVS
ncbi:type VII secretion-associated protein [Mycolicibacterium tusciae]|uniref:type VII secretion-associated protein n=1 Tax=Mycolicibacterium tusciae TaxID=75922 RepID=UPI00024A3F6D|nr:type VII secretion-associated protein [Mycolicibacterium tusciae]